VIPEIACLADDGERSVTGQSAVSGCSGPVSRSENMIRLEFGEKDNMELSYTTVPAVKVSGLTDSADCQGKGIGKDRVNCGRFG